MAKAKKTAQETVEVKHEPAPDPEIISVKGFGLDWTCRGFAFEIGKSYEHKGKVEACYGGFHAIEGNPMEVFEYYAPGVSRYALVKQSGDLSRHSNDSKLASAKITIDAELKIPELVTRAIDRIISKTTPSEAKHSEGDRSAASSTGYRSAAMSAGYEGRVMAADGCAMFLVYRDGNYNILHSWAGIAGRDGIEPLAWYQLGSDGKPFKVSP